MHIELIELKRHWWVIKEGFRADLSFYVNLKKVLICSRNLILLLVLVHLEVLRSKSGLIKHAISKTIKVHLQENPAINFRLAPTHEN